MTHVETSLKPSPQSRIGASIGTSWWTVFSIPKCGCLSLPTGHFIPYSILWQQKSDVVIDPGDGLPEKRCSGDFAFLPLTNEQKWNFKSL